MTSKRLGRELIRTSIRRAAASALRAIGYQAVPLSQTASGLEQAQLDLLKPVKEPVIFDVGANVGQSLRQYAALFPRATIHSFEPFSSAFEQLTAAASSILGATVHRLAVSDQDSQATLHVNPAANYTNSLLARPRVGRRYYPGDAELPLEQRVPTTTLDSFSERQGITHIHILKVDVQGAEAMVFRGAQRLLRSGLVDLIRTEVMFVSHYEGAALFAELASELGEVGYSLFNLYDLVVARNGQLRLADALFVSPTVRREIIDAFPQEP